MTQTRDLPYHAADLADCAADFLVARMTGQVAPDAHPLARELMREEVRLTDFAAGLNPRFYGTGGLKRFAALTLSDFGSPLASGMGTLVKRSYEATAREFRPLLAPLPVPNFRPVVPLEIDLGEITGPGNPSLPAQMPALTTRVGNALQLLEVNVHFTLARALLINDDLAALALMSRQLGSHLARLEGAAIASVLETNGNLSDASPLFTGENDLTGGLDVTALGAASAALRNQDTVAGLAANTRAALLIVPPAMEMKGRVLVSTLSTGQAPLLELIVLPWLTVTDTWFLAGSATDTPCLSKLILAGSDGEPMIEQGKAPPNWDGMGIAGRHTFNVAATSRIGIVRTEAS